MEEGNDGKTGQSRDDGHGSLSDIGTFAVQGDAAEDDDNAQGKEPQTPFRVSAAVEEGKRGAGHGSRIDREWAREPKSGSTYRRIMGGEF
jgi:hypothetical protein